MLRFIWNDHGKYSKSSKFPITGFENNGTAGFTIYLEFTPEDKGKFMNRILTVWPGDTSGKVNGKEMHNRILSIGKEISPDIENKMKKNDRLNWGKKVIELLKWKVDLESDQFIILAGNNYILPIKDSLIHIEQPFYKMRLGERLSFLNKELEDYKEE